MSHSQDDPHKVRKTYFVFSFFAFKPAWRRLPEEERHGGIEEFVGVVDRFQKAMTIRAFNTTGLKGNTEFFLWAVCDDPDRLQEFGVELHKTAMYEHLSVPHHYFSVTKNSQYSDGHDHDDPPPPPDMGKYLFVYPFVKTKEWYKLPFEERGKMMKEHTAIGHKFPKVRINTSYSFGIDDQEFVVAFEGDSPAEFMELVQQLRSSRASGYTERDTPMFVGARGDLREILERLSFKDVEVPFEFEDLAEYQDRAIQAILREIDQKDLVAALSGASRRLKDKFLNNMSARARQIVVEDLDAIGSVRDSAVKVARGTISRVVQRLREEDRIQPPGNGTANGAA